MKVCAELVFQSVDGLWKKSNDEQYPGLTVSNGPTSKRRRSQRHGEMERPGSFVLTRSLILAPNPRYHLVTLMT